MNRQDIMYVRKFIISEAGIVRRLIHHTIEAAYAPFYPPRAVQFFKDFHSEENIVDRHKKGEILIVQKDGDLIGTGSLVGADVVGVFVHPEFQHQGVGRSLMQELEKKAVVNGITEVMLSVSLPSRRFYESLGYKIVEDRTIDVGDGQQLDYWEAKKTLIIEEF